MKKWIVMAVLGLLSAIALAGHPGMVQHDPIDISKEGAPPEISIEMTPDPEMGWNLHITTRNFTFTPENVGGEHVPGQGHAHVFLDGKKLGRVYGNWHYLNWFSLGEHTITVSLNANNHSPLFYKGVKIEASVNIVQPGLEQRQKWLEQQNNKK